MYEQQTKVARRALTRRREEAHDGPGRLQSAGGCDGNAPMDSCWLTLDTLSTLHFCILHRFVARSIRHLLQYIIINYYLY